MGTTLLSSLSTESKEQLIHELKDFYIPYRDSLGLSLDATFGTEIEFNIEGYDNNYIDRLHKDGYHDTAREFLISIGYPKLWNYATELNNQIEIISHVLTDSKNTWQTLENILKFCIDKGAYVSKYSGAHIHVGKQLLKQNPDYWINFLELWSVFEKQIVTFTNGEYYFERVNFKDYANYSSLDLKKIIYNIREKKYDERVGQIGEKSNSINFPSADIIKNIFVLQQEVGNYNISDTIEIRCPNGTMNKVIWQNNINLICKILLSCSDENFDKELVNYLYRNCVLRNHNPKSNLEFLLCDLVFDNDFDKFCFLRQYYKDFERPKRHDAYAKSKPFWK